MFAYPFKGSIHVQKEHINYTPNNINEKYRHSEQRKNSHQRVILHDSIFMKLWIVYMESQFVVRESRSLVAWNPGEGIAQEGDKGCRDDTTELFDTSCVGWLHK